MKNSIPKLQNIPKILHRFIIKFVEFREENNPITFFLFFPSGLKYFQYLYL